VRQPEAGAHGRDADDRAAARRSQVRERRAARADEPEGVYLEQLPQVVVVGGGGRVRPGDPGTGHHGAETPASGDLPDRCVHGGRRGHVALHTDVPAARERVGHLLRGGRGQVEQTDPPAVPREHRRAGRADPAGPAGDDGGPAVVHQSIPSARLRTRAATASVDKP
jgi:hypothetical protein